MSYLAKVKGLRGKGQSAERVQDLRAWAAYLLEGREHVYMETPKGLDTANIAFEKITDPARLAAMRRQAEEWSMWWIVWSCVTNEREMLDHGGLEA